MVQRYKGILTILLTAGLFALPANAATIFVDYGAGTDVGGCGAASGAAACKTIQYAIDNSASNGDTISIAAGTYPEAITVDKELTLSGGAGVIVAPPATSLFGIDITASDVTIDSIEIDGSSASTTMWAGVRIFGAYSGITISNNEIHSFDGLNPNSSWGAGTTIKYAYGVWTMGGGSQGSRGAISGLTITGNNIHGLGDGATTGGVGLYLKSLSGASSGDGVTVQGNTFDDLADGPDETSGAYTFDHEGVAVAVLQDDDLGSNDGGAQIGGNLGGQGNTYGDGAGGTPMPIAVVVQTANSSVDEDNANFDSEVELYVVNQSHPSFNGGDAQATVDEDQLAPYAKTDELDITPSNPGVPTPGTIGYFADLGDALANSGAGAEITAQGEAPSGGSPVNAGVTIAGDTITLDFGGGNTFTVSKAALEAAGLPLTIPGTDGDDSVSIDPAAVPSTGFVYNGGSGNDDLEIGATGGSNYVHTTDPSCSEPECGNFSFASGGPITYTGLEPVVDLTVVASKTFTFTAADETITIEQDPGDATRTLIDSATMESVSFINPTSTLTVNAEGGTDTIDFDGLGTSSPGIASVVLNGGDDEDTLDIDPVLAATYASLTITANGGDPTVCQGDLLDFQLAGGQTVTFAPTPPADGTATFAGTLDVDVAYTGIERFADVEAELELVSVVIDDDDLYVGDDTFVTITVTNNSSSDSAQCVQVDLNTFPSVLNIDEDDSIAGFDPDPSAGTFDRTTKIWSIPSLAAGASETLVVRFVVDTPLTGDFTIPAEVSASNTDPDGTNNDGDDDLTINETFTFPAKAHVQSAAFITLDSGLERMLLGTYLGSPGVNGAVWCRVPPEDGDALNLFAVPELYRVCSDGLPNISGTFIPLHPNDIWLDQTGANAGRFYMTTWGSDGLYYSDDDGETWVAIEPNLGDGFGGSSGWVNVYAITEDATDGILYISANNGLVFRSLNNGTTWQQVSSLPEGPADTPWSLVSHPSTAGTLFAGTLGKGVYVTTNFGISWNAIADNADLVAANAGYVFDLEMREDGANDYLFAGTSRGVWRIDYAAGAPNWIELDTDQDAITPTGVNPEVRSVEFGEDTDGDGDIDLYAVTWGFGVLKHATPFDAAPSGGDLDPFALRGSEMTFFAVSPSGMLYAGTNDGGFYQMEPNNPIPGSSVSVDPGSELPSSLALFQNYPNPFNPTTRIEFAVPEATEIRVAVYDLLGRPVRVLATGSFPAGHHEVQFNAEGLASGTYFYRLETSGSAITRRLVLMK